MAQTSQASSLDIQRPLLVKPQTPITAERRNMENRTRNHRFLVSLTEKEMVSLMKKIRKTGLTREAYVRMVLSEKQPKERPSPDCIEILKVLRQISINMNQIALKANITGTINANAYWENSRRLQEVISEIKGKIFE